MAVYATSGTKVFIGGVLAQKATDFAAGDFTSQTWVEVGETENIGQFGDTAKEITFDSIAAARTRTLKGVRDAGTMELTCGLDPLDAGQTALIAAQASASDYAFKIELTDKPTSGASPKASQRMFIAKVMAAPEEAGEANGLLKLKVTLRINSNVVRVAASAT